MYVDSDRALGQLREIVMGVKKIFPRLFHASHRRQQFQRPRSACDGGPMDVRLSGPIRFSDVDWALVPDKPGVYVINDGEEVIYVGMAGRNGRGSLRNRLRDHSSGQMVNMFAQYLFLARVQFIPEERITHPREAKAACHAYIAERCSFRFYATEDGTAARALEDALKAELRPVLNP